MEAGEHHRAARRALLAGWGRRLHATPALGLHLRLHLRRRAGAAGQEPASARAARRRQVPRPSPHGDVRVCVRRMPATSPAQPRRCAHAHAQLAVSEYIVPPPAARVRRVALQDHAYNLSYIASSPSGRRPPLPSTPHRLLISRALGSAACPINASMHLLCLRRDSCRAPDEQHLTLKQRVRPQAARLGHRPPRKKITGIAEPGISHQLTYVDTPTRAERRAEKILGGRPLCPLPAQQFSTACMRGRSINRCRARLGAGALRRQQ